MSATGYSIITFTAGEVPTTSQWNLIGSNDAAFNTGNGFNDGILVPRHFALASVPGQANGIQSSLYAYTGTTAVAVTANTWNPYSFNTTWINSGASAYIISGNQITVPYTGLYDIKAVGSFLNATANSNYLIGFGLNNNSSPNLPWIRNYACANGEEVGLILEQQVACNSGDKLTVFYYPGSSGVTMSSVTPGTGNLPGSGDGTYVNIRYTGTIA
jgi:hypothetical protein